MAAFELGVAFELAAAFELVAAFELEDESDYFVMAFGTCSQDMNKNVSSHGVGRRVPYRWVQCLVVVCMEHCLVLGGDMAVVPDNHNDPEELQSWIFCGV